MPGALGALLLVAGHRDQLAGELLRRAHVDEALAVVEGAAPAEVIARTADSLEAMGARTSAAAARALAYASDGGA